MATETLCFYGEDLNDDLEFKSLCPVLYAAPAGQSLRSIALIWSPQSTGQC